MKLIETKVKKARPGEKPKKLTDGDGLFLFVSSSGGKLWRLAYRFNGKQELLSFGPYPAILLKEARGRKDEAKELLAAGIASVSINSSKKLRPFKLSRKRATLLSVSPLTDMPPTHRRFPISTR